MKVDAALNDFAGAADEARRLEAAGYDGGFTFEGPHDPFFPLVQAAGATERLELYTAIAIGFARNPMILANIGWDLQALSKGRFLLGLGSQIKPHIEKRFSMPWSKPAARMREMVLAIKEIWRVWAEGGRLDFRGDFYQHTLMTPMFSPGENPYGNPPILVAGVGPRMTEVAGEAADGFFVHPFHTPASLAQVTLPAIERGLAKSGRTRKDFQVSLQVMIASGSNDEEMESTRRLTKQQIAFYGSTPAYKVVLDAHGWGDLQPELNALSKQGKWGEMAERISDEVLEAVAICCPLDRIAERVRERCGDAADRVSLVAHWAQDPEPWAAAARELDGRG
ncbi:MAG: LLM class F420-dependent oxidoreductase [Myxococcota bacterium]